MPVLRAEAAQVFQQISPSDSGTVMASYCAALMGPVEDVADWAKDQGGRTGWGLVLDIDTCPDFLLSYLGRFRGVVIAPGTTPDEARRLIRESHGFQRGTRTGLISDVQQTLTGSKTVRVIERSAGPHTCTIVTRPAETPDSAATLAAAKDRRRKPLGILIDLEVTDLPLIDEGTRTIDAATGVIDTATLANVT